MNQEYRPSLHSHMRAIAQRIVVMYENKNDIVFFNSQVEKTIPYSIYTECANIRKKRNSPQHGSITFFPHESIYHACSVEMIRKYLRKAGYPFTIRILYLVPRNQIENPKSTDTERYLHKGVYKKRNIFFANMLECLLIYFRPCSAFHFSNCCLISIFFWIDFKNGFVDS